MVFFTVEVKNAYIENNFNTIIPEKNNYFMFISKEAVMQPGIQIHNESEENIV
jgi:hypothetical protein